MRSIKPVATVSVVDDDAVVRGRVRAWLERPDGCRVVSEHALGEEALAALPEERPDLVVLDVRMGAMDGLECLHRLRPLLPGARVILYTAYGTADVQHHALSGGACGLVHKDGDPESLMKAVRNAWQAGCKAAHAAWLTPQAVPADLAANRLGLSRREREFLALLAADRGNKGVANELHLSRQYVDNRLSRLYRKLSVRTAAGAVSRALRWGVLPPPARDAGKGIW
ncbi:MAG: response regulator [Limisphaerales bacterium]